MSGSTHPYNPRGATAALARHLSWKNLAKWIFGIAAVVLLVIAVWTRRREFLEAVSHLSAATLLGSLLFGALASFFNGMSWRSSYGALNMKLPIPAAFHVFLISQIGKYVPGSVWPVVTQMEMARDRGFSRSRAATASIVSMLVGLVTAAVASTTLLLSQGQATLQEYWYVVLVIPLAGALLAPPVLSRLLTVAGSVLHRPFDSSQLRGSSLLASTGWALMMWAAFGAHAWLILRDLLQGPAPTFLQALGAFALAWAAGFLVIVAPAGVGIREAALVVALGGLFVQSDALAFAIVSRVILTAIDAVGALIGLLLERKARAGQQGPSPDA